MITPDVGAFHAQVAEEKTAALPDRLRVVHLLPTVWLGSAALAWLWCVAHWAGGRPFDATPLDALALRLPLLLPLATGVALYEAHKKGHSWAAIRAALRRQPSWWRGFYPRRFRAPGDVWDRLPRAVRRSRAWFAFFLPALGIGLATLLIMQSSVDRRYAETGFLGAWPRALHALARPIGLPSVFGGLAVTGLLWVFGLQEARSRARRSRGPLEEAERLLTASTAERRFWARPEIAGLLDPPEGRRRSRRTAASPIGIEADLAERLKAWPMPLRALAAEVLGHARALRLAVEALDAELETERERRLARLRELAELVEAVDAGSVADREAALAALRTACSRAGDERTLTHPPEEPGSGPSTQR